MTMPVLDAFILIAVGLSPAIIMSIICVVMTMERETAK